MQPGRRLITGFGVGSLAKVSATHWFLIGALEGTLVAAVCMLASAIAGAQGATDQVGGFLFLGVVAFVGLPVLGVISGWIAGLAGGWLFNLACRLAGGIEIDIA